MLHGVITALVTPMLANKQIDYVSLNKLLDFQINSGIKGCVVAGSTGESQSLDNLEKITLIKHVITIVKQRIKIIVGISLSHTSAVVQFIDTLHNITGIDYIMVMTPSAVRPTQDGLYQHFSHIAHMSHVPIILYNVPARTACDLEDQTILKLAQNCSNIVGLKDATANLARCNYLMSYKPQNFFILSGDDATAINFVLAGGNGVISVISNILPKQFSQLITLVKQHHLDEARILNHKLLAVYPYLSIETNPIPVKWALCWLQIIAHDTLRLPLTPLNPIHHTNFSNILNTIFENEDYANS